MPGAVANAAPATVLPQTLCAAFRHSRSYPLLLNEYRDGTAQRELLAASSRKSWVLAKRLRATLGAEMFSQPTFTPSHTLWTAAYDLAFVADVPTYLATATGYGGLYQVGADLVTPIIAGNAYRVSATLANVTAGDLACQVRGDLGGGGAGESYGTITLSAGTHTLDIVANALSDPTPYLYCEGTTGGFEITSISLKELFGIGLLRAFYEARGGAKEPFYFYDPYAPASGQPIGSNYDATGVSTQGRHVVCFTGDWAQSAERPGRFGAEIGMIELA